MSVYSVTGSFIKTSCKLTFGHIQAALPVMAKYGRPVLVHAEVPVADVAVSEVVSAEDSKSYLTYLNSRPSSWYACVSSILSRAMYSMFSIAEDDLFTLQAVTRSADAPYVLFYPGNRKLCSSLWRLPRILHLWVLIFT